MREYEHVVGPYAAELNPLWATMGGRPQTRDPRQWIAYYDAVQTRCRRLDQICSQAQSQLSHLDLSGADSRAADLVAVRIRAISARRALLTELQLLAQAQVAILQRNAGFGDIIDIGAGIIEGFLANPTPDGAMLGGLGGMAKAMAKDHTQGQALSDQVQKLHDAGAELQRDVVALNAQQSLISVAVQRDYPKEDWTFMHPPVPMRKQ